ncbi:MAG: PAS domain-containing sensor histidine kinase, partial [Candidatus Cloacimonetes bacterium]|nr:PAS domain-containing sensor histidine kinase [Candidatus Cloacimonadota bacterium]
EWEDDHYFLFEEKKLIKVVANEIAVIIGKKNATKEKEKLQSQLRHADRLATIGQLAAGVAHELNEPLAHILGFAQLIEKDSQISEQVKKDTKHIITSSLHAGEIIKKLMLFSRQTPPKNEAVDLNKVISEGLYFLETRCSKNNIQLIQILEEDLPLIIADSSQIYQILVNLVVNAIYALPVGGKIIIQTINNVSYLSLIVEDNGTGMNKENLSQIFIPFFTTKGVSQGTGLGLAVVHGIVEAHNSKINVESKEGLGTKFEILFPIQKGE